MLAKYNIINLVLWSQMISIPIIPYKDSSQNHFWYWGGPKQTMPQKAKNIIPL